MQLKPVCLLLKKPSCLSGSCASCLVRSMSTFTACTSSLTRCQCWTCCCLLLMPARFLTMVSHFLQKLVYYSILWKTCEYFTLFTWSSFWSVALANTQDGDSEINLKCFRGLLIQSAHLLSVTLAPWLTPVGHFRNCAHMHIAKHRHKYIIIIKIFTTFL